MHELAHIFLGHTTKTNILKLHSKKNKLFEVEAESLAKHLLCPTVVLLECKILEITEIMYICAVNETVAFNQSTYLNNIKDLKYINNLEKLIKSQFYIFIKNYLKLRNKNRST